MDTLTEQQPLRERSAPLADSRPLPWVTIGWFALLLIAAYFPILKKLVDQWMTDDDVSHGFFVPLVAGYIVWRRRETLMKLEWKPAWWGLGLLVWSGLQAFI